MKKINFYITLAALCLIFKVNAQNIKSVHALKIGDTVPDLTITNFVNYDKPSLKLSDFRDKLVVLDFWSTSCGSCIAMLPTEVALQEKYGDKIKFLLVDSKNTRDNKARIIRFFDAYHPSYKKLASVVEDTLLSEYFPHEAVGYYVWIKDNIVRAITDDQDYNIKNIEDFLAGTQPVLGSVKHIDYDESKPVFSNNNGGEATHYLYRSILTSYKAGMHPSFRFITDSNKLYRGYRFVNFSLYVFYGTAYPEFGNADVNRIILKIPHPGEFSLDSTSESWKNRNLFIYETSFPPTSRIQAIKFLRTELDSYFHLKIDSEFRDTTCYVIRAGKKTDYSNTKIQPLKSDHSTETFLRDFPLSDFVRELNARSKIPFIDESGFSGTIRMTYNFTDLSNDEIIRKLKSEGLIIEKSTRRLKFWTVAQATPTN